MKQYRLIPGNSAEQLKQFPDNYFHSVVTDPPYGINFLGKDWDKDTGEEEVYRECFRVLKPGGHLLAFSAARTYHHLAMAVERAGFEIRDQIMWVYGSGFPKSQDVGRNMSKREGNIPDKQRFDPSIMIATDGNWQHPDTNKIYRKLPDINGDRLKDSYTADKYGVVFEEIITYDNPWTGWGTNLKPAHEPIVMAQKPFKGAIYKNVQEHGVGAINVDACRVGDEVRTYDLTMVSGQHSVTGGGLNQKSGEVTVQGRFPANFIHDGSDEVVQHFPDNSQRFFYHAKVSRAERHTGLDNPGPLFPGADGGGWQVVQTNNGDTTNKSNVGNNHPTVKPVALMKYLVQLVTPKGGKVLDPFNGSGSTGMACVELGMDYTGIDLDPHYIAISEKRIEAWWDKTHPVEFSNPLFTVDTK